MTISIIIICDAIRKPQLERLLNSIKPQLGPLAVEVLLVHERDILAPERDTSMNEKRTPAELLSLPVKLRYVPIPSRQGIPFNRNQGLLHAHGDIIIFIDDDCWVPENWLPALIAPLQADTSGRAILAVTGGTKVPPSTVLGDSIAALGFPGGGSLGFEKVWNVSADGFTDHLSVGNCALRRELFSAIGTFDESLKSGAEDTEFSYRMEQAGIRVKYVPDAFAYHEARTSWRSFVRWQLRRGRANYHFKKKVQSVGSFVKVRAWSAKNVVLANSMKVRFPLVLFLLSSSFALQQWGYLQEKWKHG